MVRDLPNSKQRSKTRLLFVPALSKELLFPYEEARAMLCIPFCNTIEL